MDEKIKEIMNAIYEHMTEDQKEKAKACNNVDEMMNLLGEWDIELPDDLSDIVTGGYQFFPYYPGS